MSKNNENKLVPKLRFSEFKNNGEWEENFLNEVSPAIFDGTHQTPSYTENGIPFFSVENIISGNKNKFISREDYLLATSKNKPEKGDIIITRIGNIGTSKVIDWDYEFSVYVTLAIVKQSSSFDSNYLHSYFQSSRYQKEILSKSLLNAVPCKINMDQLRRTKILLPPDKEKKEQTKIASCLSSLDELIAAENLKLNVLQKHKKGLLQNLLPQDGEINPKFRFKEFEDSGDWEETTLTQVAEYENGKAHEQDIDSDGDFIVVNSKFISQDGAVKKFTNTAFCPATKGDVLMVLSDIPKGKAIAKCFLVGEDNRYTVNQRICRITPHKMNSKILYYLLNRNPYFLAFDDGVKQTNLRKEDVLNCPLLIPKNQKEQVIIADTLSSIDELINAQSQRLTALMQHKKGLLQGLFPTINNEV
jgi:type I restriction enzyme S subunit